MFTMRRTLMGLRCQRALVAPKPKLPKKPTLGSPFYCRITPQIRQLSTSQDQRQNNSDNKYRNLTLLIISGSVLATAAYITLKKNNMDTITEWKNPDNREFYNEIIGSGDLDKFRENAGLSRNCDLKILYSMFFSDIDKKSATILIVGADGGREAQYFRKKGFKESNITLSEINKDSVRFLKKEFPQSTVLSTSIAELDTKDHFDIICWLFSGITDFSKSEQLKIISLLLLSLKKDGILIIDIPVDSNAQDIRGNYHVIDLKENIKYVGYVPSNAEINSYFEKISRKYQLPIHVQSIEYLTDTRRSRMLFGISKSEMLPTAPGVDSQAELAEYRHFSPR